MNHKPLDAHALDVSSARARFPGLSRQVAGHPAIFLDGPGGSQVPRSVIDAVANCLAHNNANDGGAFATSVEVGQLVSEARRAVADLLGCTDPDLVVFGPNMTTLTLSLSRSLARTWFPGDEIIVTRLDHDANIAPWLLAARDAGVQVRFLDINPSDCTLRVDQLKDRLTNRTRLVAVGAVSNAVGTINPVREMADIAHAVGALFFVDAVHSVPHLFTNVQDWDCDFLVCSAYKFFGPHLGILWGRRHVLENLPTYKVRPAPDTVPGRWMTGTPSFEAIAGTMAAVDYLASLGRTVHASGGRREALAAAFTAIRDHEMRLAARFLDGLALLSGWRLWGIGEPARLGERVPTFGLTHPRRTPEELAARLAEKGIFAWSGNFYAQELIEALGLAPHGLLRIGFLHYNTMDEVDRLLETLQRVGG
jgi:cysteine desulfurase family protein (TIGR01976 family)